MAGIPQKLCESPPRGMPSDTRVMPLDSNTTVDQRLRSLSTEFNRWCRSFGATPAARGVDMQSPGNIILVCEGASGNTFGAFQGQTDPDAAKQGRRELLIKHWYGSAIAAYQADHRQSVERLAAEREERQRQQQAEQARAAAARAAADIERQRTRLASAQLPVVAGCRTSSGNPTRCVRVSVQP